MKTGSKKIAALRANYYYRNTHQNSLRRRDRTLPAIFAQPLLFGLLRLVKLLPFRLKPAQFSQTHPIAASDNLRMRSSHCILHSQSPISHARSSLIAVVSGLLGMALWGQMPAAIAQNPQTCLSAIDRMQNYQSVSGDTFTSIAADYQLLPTTVSRFNPGVSSSPPAGTTILIPPLNGAIASVSGGETWQSLAERYGSRAEVLFEVNGCVAQVPSTIFIPGGLTLSGGRRSQASLPGYPLSRPSAIALNYGWQPDDSQADLVFNSGIAFAVDAPAEVLAVDSGTVAFAGERPGYGNLIVINHEQGLQTRYANLNEVSVVVGQAVAAGAAVGGVGGADGSYLYFEVRQNSASGWVAEDPVRYLPALELR